MGASCSSRFVETESMRYGNYGEAWLLRYLNRSDSPHYYTPSGRICIQSIPAVGATPDYLVLDRPTERLANSFAYVEKAVGIGEAKTTLTPEGFSIDGESILESDLHALIRVAVKNRYLLTSADLFKPNKKDGSAKVNWLTIPLIKHLLDSYVDTCEISLEDVAGQRRRSFPFKTLQKKVFVNFLTSNRGKQLLGQALVFRTNNSRCLENVNVSAFYLYLNREDTDIAEFLVSIKFGIPQTVLDHIELELNKTFYAEFYSRCVKNASSKFEDI